MTKQEAFDKLEWAQAGIQAAIGEMRDVLKDGAEFLEWDDADWLYNAIENADEARHSIVNRGLYPRLMKDTDVELD